MHFPADVLAAWEAHLGVCAFLRGYGRGCLARRERFRLRCLGWRTCRLAPATGKRSLKADLPVVLRGIRVPTLLPTAVVSDGLFS